MKRIVLVVLLASWSACEPGYESGKTKCSTSGKCPSGFICSANNLCVTASGKGGTSGLSGSGGTRVVASGGSSGRGGSGGTVGAGGGGGGGVCAIESDDSACLVCNKQRCCQQITTCITNTACPALVACFSDCTTESCEASCVASYAAGVAPYTAWGDCLSSSCSTACVSSGGAGGGGVSGVGGKGGAGAGGSMGATGGAGGSVTTCAGTLCPSGCVDTTSDVSNCGGCGRACASGQRCRNGACVCDATSCPHSCCAENLCAATQSDAACGLLGEPCGACGPSGSTVTFVDGRARGAMTGYGWVALGAQDTITDPTCQGQVITAERAHCLGGYVWNSSTALCLSGAIPALDPTNPDYTNNWGLKLGVDATLNKNGSLGNVSRTLGQPFTSMTMTVAGSPLTGLRATVHRKGDADEVEYCAALRSGVAMPLTAFNTRCYNVPVDGVALKPDDIPNIDAVGITVPSGSAAVKAANLCMTGITFSSGALANCALTLAGGGCADAGSLFCGTKCCASTHPYHCSATGTCYQTEADALAACGSTACTACVPASATP